MKSEIYKKITYEDGSVSFVKIDGKPLPERCNCLYCDWVRSEISRSGMVDDDLYE